MTRRRHRIRSSLLSACAPLLVVIVPFLLAACGGDGDGAESPEPDAEPSSTATRIPTATPTATPQPPPDLTRVSGTCGIASQAEVDPAIFRGAPYGRFSPIEVRVTYYAPGCVRIGATVSGYHLPSSRWFRHWCIDRAGDNSNCESDRVHSFFIYPEIEIETDAGVASLAATTSDDVPDALNAPAMPDGFIPCSIRVSLNDGVFGGRSHIVTAGEPCR